MPNRLYHPNMYRFADPEPSYWEATRGETSPPGKALKSDVDCEVAVIGGGYTGLSAAYHLCRDAAVDVRVLEAGHIGWGASGRNGGFCSMGGSSFGPDGLIDRFGVDEARKYYQAQVEAVQLVRDIIRNENIESPLQGDAELEVACSRKAFAGVCTSVERQKRLLGLDIEVLSREAFRERYFDCPRLHGGSILRPTFGLHPLRYVQGLAAAAERRGAIVHPQCEVRQWRREGGKHVLETSGGTVRARYVVLATNGFTPEHLRPAWRGRTLPIISAIVVTRPLSDDELGAHAWQTEAPAYTSFDLLNYFRLLPDRRLLWGGRGSSNGAPGGAAKNLLALTAKLYAEFPEWRDVPIDYRWHGLICMTRRFTPAVGRLDDDPSVFFGFGYHGNGVNNATWTGRCIAEWLGNTRRGDTAVPERLPGIMRGLSGRFPLSGLRLVYVQARIAMFRVTDWLS